MAKKQGVSFESVMGDIKARRFAPVYVLMGEEPYFIDALCGALASGVLPEEEREFNQFVFFGQDVTAAQVVEMARELPMMSEYKVIIVKEAQNIRNTEEIEKYLDRPSPQTVLVWCHKNGSIDGRKKILSKARAAGVVFESAKVGERALPQFVEEFLSLRGKTIDQRTAVVIAESVGSDLCRLASELDKLCLAMPEGEKNVTPAVAEESIGVSREYNPFEFRSSVAEKNILKANRILDFFDKNPKSGGLYVLLPVLFSYFQNLMIAWYTPGRRDRASVARHLDLRGEWLAGDYLTGMGNYSAVKTMEILSKIRETDEKLKGLGSTGATPAGDLAKELLFFIFH